MTSELKPKAAAIAMKGYVPIVTQSAPVDSWEEFESRLRELNAEQESLAKDPKRTSISKLLFRGQSEASWHLDSTLERFGSENALAYYFRAITASRPQIEAHTKQRWELESYRDVRSRFRDPDFWLPGDLPGYTFMAYLRHHSFPSPLLDWSRSAYVAAYFAFHGAGATSDRVAIFAYRETAGHGKAGSPTSPHIRLLGPYVRTHARHFLQQCQYTICTQFDGNEWRYAPHASAFSGPGADQDALWKFTIPRSEREKVLKKLDEYNLNGYSLLGSEESLMEMMAARELTRSR